VQVDLPTFTTVKKLLGRAETTYVRRYDMCPDDHVVFWDSKNLPTPYRHAHRYNCPVCGKSRYVTDPKDGNVRPAKTLFFFPVAHYIRSLYARRDLVDYLLQEVGERPEGDISKSRGYKRKVTDNPHMNNDRRNLALVGTTDGVPYFKDQRRGCWPFVLRCANLPTALSQHMSNCHLHLVAPNEYWELDVDAGVLRRQIRAPKSLQPHMSLIVDDLLAAYHRGTHTHIDMSAICRHD
jgi:hypothetical protein